MSNHEICLQNKSIRNMELYYEENNIIYFFNILLLNIDWLFTRDTSS
ncbi:MAG: hypothetical protein GY754_02740 [bacterium]|nr:hypothetical protein [bacterium]